MFELHIVQREVLKDWTLECSVRGPGKWFCRPSSSEQRNTGFLPGTSCSRATFACVGISADTRPHSGFSF
jgi:hypothetical protein